MLNVRQAVSPVMLQHLNVQKLTYGSTCQDRVAQGSLTCQREQHAQQQLLRPGRDSAQELHPYWGMRPHSPCQQPCILADCLFSIHLSLHAKKAT